MLGSIRRNSFLRCKPERGFRGSLGCLCIRSRPFWAFGPVNWLWIKTINNGISCFSTSGIRIIVKNYKKDGFVKEYGVITRISRVNEFSEKFPAFFKKIIVLM